MDVLIGKGKHIFKDSDTIKRYDGLFDIVDENYNTVYEELEEGTWNKRTWDSNGETSYKDSKGYFQKTQFNEKGDMIYLETSKGIEIDTRKKEITIEEIERLLGYEIKIVKGAL